MWIEKQIQRFLREPLAAYASSATIAPERVGEVSNDRSAVVGKNGWCFIYEGSNNYRGAYHDVGLAPLGDQWASLIEQRQRKCEALGARFVQLIVPNKATIMPENYPEPLGAGVTPMLHRLLESTPTANFLCPVEEMRNPVVRDYVFRRNDNTHLTLVGNAMLVVLLLAAVGVDPVSIPCIETTRVNHTGDLGSKFAEPISEWFCAPKYDVGLLDQRGIEKTHEIVVDGFNGTRQSFHNPGAPIKQTLLVFGNSFFERTPSWGMSPILAALFEEFHFVWTPVFDEACAVTLEPDIIICQTCERFMIRLPTS
jgi:hypothetical protein